MAYIMRYLITLCLLVVVSASLIADEVHLADGRILSGKIIENPADGQLRFKVIVGSMSMVMNIDRKDIVKIETGKTASQLALENIEAKRKALGKQPSAETLWQLALELKEAKHTLVFKQYARDVAKLDPQHAAAQTALGMVQHDGQWMTPHQMHIAKGEVYFEGKWLSQANVDQIVAEREALRIEAKQKRQERILARQERRDREKAQAFTNIQLQDRTIRYGGVSLYHNCPQHGFGFPTYGSTRYRSSSRSGFSFRASGGGSSSSWNLGINF